MPDIIIPATLTNPILAAQKTTQFARRQEDAATRARLDAMDLPPEVRALARKGLNTDLTRALNANNARCIAALGRLAFQLAQ